MRDGDKRGNWQSFVRLHAHVEIIFMLKRMRMLRQ